MRDFCLGTGVPLVFINFLIENQYLEQQTATSSLFFNDTFPSSHFSHRVARSDKFLKDCAKN